LANCTRNWTANFEYSQRKRAPAVQRVIVQSVLSIGQLGDESIDEVIQ
jgi:hypothetical protein